MGHCRRLSRRRRPSVWIAASSLGEPGGDEPAAVIDLLAPAEFSFDSGVTVDRLRLGSTQAQLSVSGGLLPSLDLHASLRQVGPALVNAFMPGLLADGDLTAEAELTGSLARPIGRIQTEATGIRFASELASGLPAAGLKASYCSRRM